MIALGIIALHFLVVQAASSAGGTSPILLVGALCAGVGALIGVITGIVALLDRNRASDRADWALAKDQSSQALNEVNIFRASLQEERERRDVLEKDLAAARQELREALASHDKSQEEVNALQVRIVSLEQSLVHYTRITNQLSAKMLTNGETDIFLHERWQNLVEDQDIDAIQIDFNGMIVFATEGAAKGLGYIPPELIGHSLIDLIPDEDRPQYLATALRVGVDANMMEITTRMKRKDNNLVRVILGLSKNRSSITIVVTFLGAL